MEGGVVEVAVVAVVAVDDDEEDEAPLDGVFASGTVLVPAAPSALPATLLLDIYTHTHPFPNEIPTHSGKPSLPPVPQKERRKKKLHSIFFPFLPFPSFVSANLCNQPKNIYTLNQSN